MFNTLDTLNRLQTILHGFCNDFDKVYTTKSKGTTTHDGLYYRLVYSRKEGSAESAAATVNTFRETYLSGKFSKTVTRQAFLNRENKITVDDLNNIHSRILSLLNVVTSDTKIEKRIAIDGMHIALLKTLSEDGYSLNKNEEAIDALSICIHDVTLNNPLILNLVKHKNERKAFRDVAKILQKYRNAICIFDRGFMSTEMIAFLNKHNLRYVIRVKCNYHDIGDKVDMVITTVHEGTTYPVRLVRYVKNNEDYFLATNLFGSSEYSIPVLTHIYTDRWSVEEQIKYLRNNYRSNNMNERCDDNVNKTMSCKLIVSSILSLIEQLHHRYHEMPSNATINRTLLTTGIFNDLLPKLIYKIDLTMDWLERFTKKYIKPYLYNESNRTCERIAVRPFRKWYTKRYLNTGKSGYVSKSNNNNPNKSKKNNNPKKYKKYKPKHKQSITPKPVTDDELTQLLTVSFNIDFDCDNNTNNNTDNNAHHHTLQSLFNSHNASDNVYDVPNCQTRMLLRLAEFDSDSDSDYDSDYDS